MQSQGRPVASLEFWKDGHMMRGESTAVFAPCALCWLTLWDQSSTCAGKEARGTGAQNAGQWPWLPRTLQQALGKALSPPDPGAEASRVYCTLKKPHYVTSLVLRGLHDATTSHFPLISFSSFSFLQSCFLVLVSFYFASFFRREKTRRKDWSRSHHGWKGKGDR